MRHKKLYIVLSILLAIILMDEIRWSYQVIKFYLETSEFQLQWIVPKCMIIVGLVGLILFLSSKFHKTVVLRFYCCYVIMNFFLSLWYYRLLFIQSEIREYFKITFWTWLGISIEFVLVIICGLFLWFLTKARVSKLRYTVLGGETFAEFAPASTWKRLLHYIVDTAFLMYFCYQWVKVLTMLPYENMREHMGLVQNPWLFALIVFVCYYIIFEGIFKTTAGKCLSNTVLANEEGKRPSFAVLAGRTFYRLIPFDPLSFFAASRRGWHDKISDTYVTDSVPDGDQQPEEEADPKDLLSAYDVGLQT